MTTHPTSVTLPETTSAHLLAHRIVERVNADSSLGTLAHAIASVTGRVTGAASGRVTGTVTDAVTGPTAGNSAAQQRIIVGIVGAPGAGKSTITAEIAEVLHERDISVAICAMDGFHLSNTQLAVRGLSNRKGAPETFDAAGFLATLRRIATGTEDVYVPVFHRDIEESFAADALVPAHAQVVLVEGNYLLLDAPYFEQVNDLLWESWFLELDESTRIDRLVLRHVRHGKTPHDAIDWSLGPDQRNAERIAQTAQRASLIVHLTQ